jgi:glycoside/pentoside/hexuronide:cation symporter, GPH family
VALDVIGFPHGVAGNAAKLAAIPPETIRNLGIAYGPGAAVFTAVSVAVLLTYRLNKTKYAGIQAELHTRRAAQTAD